MNNTLQLIIVLPEKAVPPRPIRGIDLPAADGRLTLLAHHQPLIAALVPGTAIITSTTGERENWKLSAGAVQMEKNTACLLVTEATLLESHT